MQTFQRDGQVRVADTAADAVALRFAGWVEVQADDPEDDEAEPTSDKPAKPKRSTSRRPT